MLTRRELILGAGIAASTTHPLARSAPRFDVQRFTDDCRKAGSSQASVKEVLARAISDPATVLKGVGEPEKGGIRTLYRSPELTILNIVWSPLMHLLAHEHNMWALIGIYTGREDNIFWERRDGRIAASRATDLSAGDVTSLPRDVIHSVANPIDKLTGAIHIYGGDFFATPRSEWDPETLAEREWNIESAIRTFKESNERFLAWRKGCAAWDQ